jgi:hypothetical protein
MNRIIYVISGILLAGAICPAYPSDAWKAKPSVEKGRYYEADTLSAAKLKYLPIPLTREDYALIQSIENRTSIVIGRFSSGERTITMITDSDNDGAVNEVMTYYVDLGNYMKSPEPAKEYPADKFTEMKRQIINGVKGDLYPNAEGAQYVKKLLDSRSPLVRTVRQKNGFKVVVDDADKKDLHRAEFYFADNANKGFDLVFQVQYTNLGSENIYKPIKYSVYCKGSSDKLIGDVTKDLSKYASARYSGD